MRSAIFTISQFRDIQEEKYTEYNPYNKRDWYKANPYQGANRGVFNDFVGARVLF